MFVPRVWMLYLVMAGALFFLLDREQLGDDLLNACHPGMDYVHAYAYGKNKFNREELVRAVAYYKTLLLTNPRLPFVYADMGFCYFYLNDLDKADAAYRTSSTMASFVYTTYFDLGFIALSRKNYPEAVHFFEKSRSLVPRSREQFLEILKINPKYHNDASLQEGSAVIQRISHDLRLIYVYLGRAYIEMKDYPRLNALASEGVSLFTDDPEMYFDLGAAFFNLSDFRQALFAFEQTIAMAPDYTEAYFYRSRIWQLIGDVGRYQKDMAKYQELKSSGGWKRGHDILDLHHWHDRIFFFQMFK